jgi:hypothetical protein
MMNQHQSVVFFTKQVLGNRFEGGRDVKEYGTKDDKRRVAELVADGMLRNEVELSPEARAKYAGTKEGLISKYVMGMVTNWWNKSKELNGGVKYETKNPGTRAGSGDPILKELRALVKHLESVNNTEGVAKVNRAIQDRLLEIEPKPRAINTELIPAHLRDLIK